MSSDSIDSNGADQSVLEKSKNAIGAVLGTDSPDGRVLVTPANWLTMLRLAIVPFFWWMLYSPSLTHNLIATALFILGALSDLWDGRLARRNKQITPFGDFMDPLADKLLVLSAFWGILFREPFGAYFLTSLFWIILITSRETAVTFLRIWAIEGGSSLVTSAWGKWKTGIHLTVIILTLALFNLTDILIQADVNPAPLKTPVFYLFLDALLFLCMIPSVGSGILYFRGGNRKKLP